MSLVAGLKGTLLPKKFLASGINCGVRRYRPDLGLILSEVPCVAAGVFTINQCKAAPVLYNQKILPSDQIRAIITNSGQANAATGPEGIENNLKMAKSVADKLGVKAEQVLTASTGVIGQQLAMEKIIPAIPELISRTVDTVDGYALSILTTDLVPKTVSLDVQLSSGSVRITGVCKGSGMIHPNMATMLGYIMTDVALSKQKAHEILKSAVDISFNMISVDGDCSTNDTVFLLANGASGANIEKANDEKIFVEAFVRVAQALAQSIALDGEGATKLLEVRMVGAPQLELARRAVRSITVSPLIKTAVHGEDPNWGRILARLGAEQVPAECLQNMSLRIQGVLIFESGKPVIFDREYVKSLLKKKQVQVDIDLKSGQFEATAWGCDLSKKYVEINTDYTT